MLKDGSGHLVRQAPHDNPTSAYDRFGPDHDIINTHQPQQDEKNIAIMLAFDTADKANEYCERLVTIGMKGGFMLSSECEVPTNVKIENLKAFINFLK